MEEEIISILRPHLVWIIEGAHMCPRMWIDKVIRARVKGESYALDELEQIINCSIVTAFGVALRKGFVTLNGRKTTLTGLIET